MKKFTITNDHLKLLQKAYVDWDDCEYGAPEINPKRPYGNSNVEYDIAKILGWSFTPNEDISEEMSKSANKIHRETKIALQICLITQKFEIGTFEKLDEYDSRSWNKI